MGRWAVLLVTGVLACSAPAPGPTVLVVRHAERPPGTKEAPNVNLLSSGHARAAALVPIATDAKVSKIYTTAWCRTAQTAQPTARALGIPLHVQPSKSPKAGLSKCDPPIEVPQVQLPKSVASNADLSTLVGKDKGTVMVVGHSNTVRQVSSALGANMPGDIPSQTYDQLYVVLDAKRDKARGFVVNFGARSSTVAAAH